MPVTVEKLIELALEEADRENDIRRRMKDAVIQGDTAAIIDLAKLWALPEGFNAVILDNK